MIWISLGLVALLVAQTVIHRQERESAAAERSRLTRLAFADTKAERIAAVLPESRKVSPPKDDRPTKPLGI